MMKDLNYGIRDKKGNWKPFKIDISPSIINSIYPLKPLQVLNYFYWVSNQNYMVIYFLNWMVFFHSIIFNCSKYKF